MLPMYARAILEYCTRMSNGPRTHGTVNVGSIRVCSGTLTTDNTTLLNYTTLSAIAMAVIKFDLAAFFSQTNHAN